MITRYVQHKSGQGEKWELAHPVEMVRIYEEWSVRKKDRTGNFYLPASEYILCDPPEVWRDVTEDMADLITENSSTRFQAAPCGIMMNICVVARGYRLRKVQPWLQAGDMRAAFIVEKREE